MWVVYFFMRYINEIDVEQFLSIPKIRHIELYIITDSACGVYIFMRSINEFDCESF